MCFSDSLDYVVFANDFKDFAQWAKNFPESLQMYRLGCSENGLTKNMKNLQSSDNFSSSYLLPLVYPTKISIVSTNGYFNLTGILTLVKRTVLWSSSSVFLFVDENLNNGCAEAGIKLTEAWVNFDILHSIYVCFDEVKKIRFYKINPYSNRSSEFWEIISTTHEFNDEKIHPLTLYRLQPDSKNI